MTEEQLSTATEEEIKNFIRLVLINEGATSLKDHARFEMSGYERKTGECTLKNLSVLNKFAYLGIYDYTNFLFLDFYKGTPTLYLQYFSEYDDQFSRFDFSGYSTSEIVYEILKLTVLSARCTRRRD